MPLPQKKIMKRQCATILLGAAQAGSYNDLQDEMIPDRIVVGIKKTTVSLNSHYSLQYRLEILRKESAQSPELNLVANYVMSEWPEKVPRNLQKYRQAQGDLSFTKVLMCFNKKKCLSKLLSKFLDKNLKITLASSLFASSTVHSIKYRLRDEIIRFNNETIDTRLSFDRGSVLN